MKQITEITKRHTNIYILLCIWIFCCIHCDYGEFLLDLWIGTTMVFMSPFSRTYIYWERTKDKNRNTSVSHYTRRRNFVHGRMYELSLSPQLVSYDFFYKEIYCEVFSIERAFKRVVSCVVFFEINWWIFETSNISQKKTSKDI